MDLKEESLLGGAVGDHWYYKAKLRALRRALPGVAPGPVLDVGAGSGFFSRSLLRAGLATSAVCVDPGYPADRDEWVGGRPLQFRRRVADAAGGLVLMMDVLEHVADDVALLREYMDPATPGTRVLVTVPAFQALWSGHDVFLEHYRRYTLRQTEALLRAAGLVVELGCYFYGAVLPLAAGLRLGRRLMGDRGTVARSDMRPFGPAATAVFDAVCAAELAVFRKNRIAGLSVFARGVKP